jgi:hypothetical protein
MKQKDKPEFKRKVVSAPAIDVATVANLVLDR